MELVNNVTQLKLQFNLQAIKTAKLDYWSQQHLLFGFTESPFYIATKAPLLFNKTAQSFLSITLWGPCMEGDISAKRFN